MTVSGMSVFMVTASHCGRPRPTVPPKTNADTTLPVRGNQDGTVVYGSGLAAAAQPGPRDGVAARRCASLGVAEGGYCFSQLPSF